MAWYASNTAGSSPWGWDHLLNNQSNYGHGSSIHHCNNSNNTSQEPSPWKLAPPSPPTPEDRLFFPVHHDSSSSSLLSSCIPPTSSEMASSSPYGETNPQPSSLNMESSPPLAWIDSHKRGSESWDRLFRDRNHSELLDVIGVHNEAYKATKDSFDSSNFGRSILHSGDKSLHCADLQSTALWSADHASEQVKSEVKCVSALDEQLSSTTASASGESSIGLHLGKRTYFQDNNCTPTGPKSPAKTNNRTSKRPRVSANQVARCQVEGCNADLSSSKDYHRRHKVCETHSKAGKAIVANQEQRFCQQCSRFHLLAEFDEAKRSCRRRLAGHNERRRKPQPDPLLQARLQSNYQAWPFVQHSRLSGIPALWQGSIYNYRLLEGSYHMNNRFEEKNKYDLVEAHLRSRVLSHHATNDRFPLVLFQNSKETIPFSMSHASDKCSNNGYISGSFDPLYGCPTVVSSTSSLDLSGFRASSIANTHVTGRVTDSGRALSLLSPDTRSMYASNVIPLDIAAFSTVKTEIVNPDSCSQQFIKGSNHYNYGSSEKLLSAVPLQSSHNDIPSSNLSPGCVISFGKTHNEDSSIGHGLTHSNSFLEGQSILTALPGRAEDAKHTIDLMRISSQAINGVADEKPIAFQLGSNAFGDIQYMYESTF